MTPAPCTVSASRVVVRDQAGFARKRRQLVADGSEHLQVIADFDYTLTKFWVNGKRGLSSHGVIEECGLLSAEYHDRAEELKTKYYPLEVDHSLSLEDRIKYMVEWVDHAHKAMVDSGLTKQMVQEAVRSANIALRDGHDWLFQELQRKQVPLLIFSAGLADVLEEVLRQHALQPVPDTAHIISNRMSFGRDGRLTGFTGQLFHVFNKHAGAVQHEPYFVSEEVKRRANVLVLGDSIGDLNMAKGLPAREVLSIAFLNDKVEERLEEYSNVYDAVIIGDGGFEFVQEILSELQ